MTSERVTQAYFRHELRTPLNHIIGYGEMLLEDVDSSERADFQPSLQRILEEARNLLQHKARRAESHLWPCFETADRCAFCRAHA